MSAVPVSAQTADTHTRPVRALFINSGILGQKTFAQYIARLAREQNDIDITQIVLTDGLTRAERLARFLWCLRVWPDGLLGVRNLDLRRYRAELSAGLRARARMAALERAGQRFDVLHFHRQATAYGNLHSIRRVPTAISIDCTQSCAWLQTTSPLERLTYELNVRSDGRVFAAADCIISTSQWAAACVRAEYPGCRTPIVVMPNPVELDSFDAAWAEARYTRATRTPDYRPRVLFMGGDFPRKGGYDLLAAWKASGLGQRASLDVATDWPLVAADVPDGVRIHPEIVAHSEKWKTLWQEADIFVMPTRNEAFGNVFQEAAAAGLPAIGTRLMAIPEMVTDGQTGLLVAREDREALVRALGTLVASADLRRQMGEAARLAIEERADSRDYCRKLVDLLRELAARGKSAAAPPAVKG